MLMVDVCKEVVNATTIPTPAICGNQNAAPTTKRLRLRPAASFSCSRECPSVAARGRAPSGFIRSFNTAHQSKESRKDAPPCSFRHNLDQQPALVNLSQSLLYHQQINTPNQHVWQRKRCVVEGASIRFNGASRRSNEFQ